jgi:hypothetical protein
MQMKELPKYTKMLKTDYVILTKDEARTILHKIKQADLIISQTFKRGKNEFWN